MQSQILDEIKIYRIISIGQFFFRSDFPDMYRLKSEKKYANSGSPQRAKCYVSINFLPGSEEAESEDNFSKTTLFSKQICCNTFQF